MKIGEKRQWNFNGDYFKISIYDSEDDFYWLEHFNVYDDFSGYRDFIMAESRKVSNLEYYFNYLKYILGKK